MRFKKKKKQNWIRRKMYAQEKRKLQKADLRKIWVIVEEQQD